MQQLSTLDAWFIDESDTSFQHICDILIFEAEEGPSLTLKELRSVVEERLHMLPPLRRRLIDVPFGMDEPYWIEDPEFDLDNHLHEATLPEPGDDRQLAEHVAALAATPLDRGRPLWELHLVHGLEGDRSALIKKFHHAAVDGASGVEVTTILLDTSPEGREIPPAEPWTPDEVPDEKEMMKRGFEGMAKRPQRMLEVQKRMLERMPKPGEAITSPTGEKDKDGGLLSAPQREAPETPLNRKITAERSVAYGTIPLEDIKTIKKAFETTLNDVVVAVCASSMRRWLEAHDALLDEPLLVCVPVSVRTGEQQGTFGNRVSLMVAEFPTHVADPVERLRAAHEAMKVAKDEHNAIGANVLADFGEFYMPALQARASRATAQFDMPEEDIRWNLAVSNIPGPREPLYLAGHKLEGLYPIGMLNENMGVMIALISYRDHVGVGIVACPDLVPDVWSLLDGVREGLAELSEARVG